MAVELFRPDESRPPGSSFQDPTTPTTPRQHAHSNGQADMAQRNMPETNNTTPTGPPTSQYPELPNTSQPPSTRDENIRPISRTGTQGESWMMDVDDSDHEQDGSDNGTENGEGDGSLKKKKGQRFFCTGYPPCNLSFTRSEHLARHIRKHTGERPFQCHCHRRFSRLDNLRQHAQTVHLNEEIPTDSLAATGTRFQRQVRTDRVRPAGRPRTNTMGSTGSHGRGHSRNLSTSSIGSTSSNFSTNTDTRRRPPPLLMASDPASRPQLGIEPPRTPPSQYRTFTTNSPGDISTPTSAYVMTPSSPGYGSSMGSPISTPSRATGFLGNRTPGRRSSVPSGISPFQQQYGSPNTGPYNSSMPPPAANNSPTYNQYSTPTISNFSYSPQYQVPPGEDWRRRTWHPSTFPNNGYNYARPATSGLSYSQTPDAPQPAHAQNSAATTPATSGQAPRLPGIESFDQVRPSTPPRRGPSPMQVEASPQSNGLANANPPTQFGGYLSEQRNNRVSWDATTYPRHTPNDASYASRDATSWGQQTLNEIQNVAGRHEPGSGSTSLSSSYTGPSSAQHQQQIARDALRAETNQNTRNRRNGWYNGPIPPARTSPEEGSSSSEGIQTPGTGSIEVNPVIVHSNEYLEPHHTAMAAEAQPSPCLTSSSQYRGPPPQRSYYSDDRRDGQDMGRLEALVAVATSEDQVPPAVR